MIFDPGGQITGALFSMIYIHVTLWRQYLSAIVCCSLMPTLNSTGNTRRGLPSLISSGIAWKASRGNGTSTVKWSLNGEERGCVTIVKFQRIGPGQAKKKPKKQHVQTKMDQEAVR